MHNMLPKTMKHWVIIVLILLMSLTDLLFKINCFKENKTKLIVLMQVFKVMLKCLRFTLIYLTDFLKQGSLKHLQDSRLSTIEG